MEMLRFVSRFNSLLPFVIQSNKLKQNQTFINNIKRNFIHTGKFTMAHESKVPKIDENNVTIGTHDGIFHCDEILACFMLQQLPKYQNAEIIRTRDDNLLKQCDIVVDVGGIFDKSTNRFDHHQKTFNETLSTLRPEFGNNWKVRLSSAGLIYTYFGEDVIRQVLKTTKGVEPTNECLQRVYTKVYEYLIQEIDGIDNGVPQFDGEPLYRITTNLSSRVGNFNREWNSTADYNDKKQFERAKQLVGEEFVDKVVYYATTWWPARAIVDEAIKKRFDVHESGEIIELTEFCPWKQHLYDLEKVHNIESIIKYCISENKADDFRVICVPVTANSFVCRKFLPASWRGTRDTELQENSQVKDANFCHATGFIGGAKSREGILKMAIKAVENKSSD